MKMSRIWYWVLPAGVLLASGGWTLSERARHEAESGMRRYYHSRDNLACGLARGYARKFETVNGRRPEIAELSEWAVGRFAEDFEISDQLKVEFRASGRSGIAGSE